MRMTRLVSTLVAIAAVVGCGGGKHLTQGFGESYVSAFAAQAPPTPKRRPTQAVTGLDSQEASIVVDAYRNSLAPKGTKVEEESLIYIAPPMRERGQPLAPSVPKEK